MGLRRVLGAADAGWLVAGAMIGAGIFYTPGLVAGRLPGFAAPLVAWMLGGSAFVAYATAKAGVVGLTNSLAREFGSDNIRVNAIAPGVVDGEHWDGVDAFFAKYENKAPGEKKREVGAAVPFGRMGTADDLTGMAIFLASAEADYVVAQTYNVDGGNWMS